MRGKFADDARFFLTVNQRVTGSSVAAKGPSPRAQEYPPGPVGKVYRAKIRKGAKKVM